jgi:hypothetical protein
MAGAAIGELGRLRDLVHAAARDAPRIVVDAAEGGLRKAAAHTEIEETDLVAPGDGAAALEDVADLDAAAGGPHPGLVLIRQTIEESKVRFTPLDVVPGIERRALDRGRQAGSAAELAGYVRQRLLAEVGLPRG